MDAVTIVRVWLRSSMAWLVLAVLLGLAGCGDTPRGRIADSSASQQKPAAESAQTIADRTRYAAAAVIEGGRGEAPKFELPGESPLWRLYLCFERTGERKSGEIEIDLEKLGTPAETKWIDAAEDEVLYIRRLPRVTLHYEYDAKFTVDEWEDASYAFGSVNLDLSSDQPWETVFSKPEIVPPDTRVSAFDQEWSHGMWGSFTSEPIAAGGALSYVAVELRRFGYSRDKDGTSLNRIQECEENQADYFFEWVN